MSRPTYGRVQVAEPPHTLACLHVHDGVSPLKEVDHEPRVAVLDQSDLLAQGIRCSTFIQGAQDVDALGSCVYNTAVEAASNVLGSRQFAQFVTGKMVMDPDGIYQNAAACEKLAITWYHQGTDQTGDPASEWPPTDCGSSGVYSVQLLQRLGAASGATVASAGPDLISLMQADGVMMGSPWFFAWEEPDANGFVDGDGSADALRAAIKSGIAGGHETYLSAVEKLAYHPGTSVIDPFNTVLRDRNHWRKDWGDNGSCRLHLSTLMMLGGHADFRQLTP